jgi:von Willebrand factor type A domain
MILLDVSRSMLAEDVIPNRLARAKSDLKDLVQVLQKEGGHRLGLVVFAGQASLQCPLTLDYPYNDTCLDMLICPAYAVSKNSDHLYEEAADVTGMPNARRRVLHPAI